MVFDLKDGMHVAVAGSLRTTSQKGIEERLAKVGLIRARPEDADVLLLGAKAGKAADIAASRGIPVLEEEDFLVALKAAEYAAGVELLVVIEVDGHWGEHMAEVCDLVLDELASDELSRVWWDGELCVWELPTGFGRPLEPRTRLICGNLNRLKKAAQELYLRANRGRPRPKNPPPVPVSVPEKRLRVVGYPNKGFYRVCSKLNELKRVGWDKATTYL